MADEWKEKVDRIINSVSEKAEVDWSEARTLVHKYVCEGKCGWYKTKSRKADFNRHNLTQKQKNLIEETVKQVMKELKVEKAKWQIHEILCPGHPRPRPE